MANLTFFLITVIALQGCYGASLQQPKLNELEEVVQEFADAMKEVQKILSLISGHLTSVIRDYEHEFEKIVESYPTYPIIVEFRKNISELEETELTDKNKECFREGWAAAAAVTEFVKIGLDDCLNNARLVSERIERQLDDIEERATKIQNELSEGLHECLPQYDDVKCLKDIIEPIKIKLENVQKELNAIHEEIHGQVNDGKKNLGICMQNVQAGAKSRAAVSMVFIKYCIKRTSVSSEYSFEDVTELIENLKQTIQYIIHLAANLPASIKEIPDKINEIISDINISALYTQLKNQVHEIIKKGGDSAETCRPQADNNLDEIINTAEVEAKACMSKTETKVDEIEAEFGELAKKGTQLLVDVNKAVLDCVSQNPVSPIEFTKCLLAKADNLKREVSDLQDEVTGTVHKAEEQAHELLISFRTCANKMQLDAIEKGENLVSDVGKCVLNSKNLY